MRFDVGTTTSKSAMSGRNRLRLWMLVGSLGIVLATMNQLGKEETAERLDQLFGIAENSRSTVEMVRDSEEPTSDDVPFSPESGQPSADAPFSTSETNREQREPERNGIEDNTYFRSEERAAWFDTFDKLEAKSLEQLSEESVGEVAYAQLVNQPDEYRHEIVTVTGTVVRQELQRPSENRLEIEEYHRLWLSPRGGGQWPIVIYCRELPDEFPLEDKLAEKVTVVGSFFKNWSYAYDDGLGIAPVVLANSVIWQKPSAQSVPDPLPAVQLIWAAAGAGVLALGIVWWAMRRTMRPHKPARDLPVTFLESEATADSTTGERHD